LLFKCEKTLETEKRNQTTLNSKKVKNRTSIIIRLEKGGNQNACCEDRRPGFPGGVNGPGNLGGLDGREIAR